MENQTREPSPRKGVFVPPARDEDTDKEIEHIFEKKAPVGEEPVHDNFDKFIRSTARSKITVIIPMFGYWADVKDGFLDEEVLRATVNRVTSASHTLYAVIVAEPPRMSQGVYQTLSGRYVGGNVRGVEVPSGSSYAEYVAEGMRVALEETDAQYVVIYNPWGVIQNHGIDMLVERVNLNAISPVICGYDMCGELKPEQFDKHSAHAPREFASYKAKHLLSFNFMGMKRFVAEMCKVDPRFKTQQFAERDFFQQIAQKDFDIITSERVPVFFFDVPWEQYVPQAWYAADLDAFRAKWGFTPGDIKIN